jgi:transcription elongation GreA/GreB family factor
MSSVEIRDNIRKTKRQLCLIYLDKNASGSETVSVLTPMGAALSGLSEGGSIECLPLPRVSGMLGPAKGR